MADRAYQMFRRMQSDNDMDAADFAGAKQELRHRLDELNDELNRALAREYGVQLPAEPDKPARRRKAANRR